MSVISLSPIFNCYSKHETQLFGSPNDSLSSEFDLYRHFVSVVDVSVVRKWINNTFVCESIKSNEKAKRFREEGNKFYGKNQLREATEAYSKSICYSEDESEESALAFANRSAVHYAQKCYQSCLKDIENCRNVGSYPERLRSKLALREVRCLKILGVEKERSDEIISDLKRRSETNGSIGKIIQEIEDLQIDDYNQQNDIGIQYKIPSLTDGPNPTFLYASSSVQLNYTSEKGRHVTAMKDIQQGDVLFVEKPYTLVPTLINNSKATQRCYYCYKRTNSPIPCTNCDMIYCDITCKKSAWSSFHKYECCGNCVNAWTQLGVSYLALRLTLLGATRSHSKKLQPPEQVSIFEYSKDAHLSIPADQVSIFGNTEDNYPYIYSMTTNLDKITNEIKLINLTMALCLVEYLKMKTSFFEDQFKTGEEDLEIKMGGTILRHLLQVTANASMIEDFNEGDTDFNEDNSYVRAVGMYPTHSMLNHSCDPNITLYYCNDTMVVKARRTIKAGEEICNSYGYSCYKESTTYRQRELLKQYCFVCRCSACTHPTKPEIFTESLLCKCKSCALPTNSNSYQCTSCKAVFDPKEHIQNLKSAEDLFNEGKRFNDFNKLVQCLQLRRKYVPENSELIRETLQSLIEDSLIGFESWWTYSQQLIQIERHLIPYHSTTYANNIKFTIEMVHGFLEQESIQHFQGIEEVPLVLEKMNEEIKELYRLFYPLELVDLSTLDKLCKKIVNTIKNIVHYCVFFKTPDPLSLFFQKSAIDR